MKKIVVTGAGAVLGQGIIKSLRSATLDCEILAVDPNPFSPGLYWGDRGMIIPMASDPAYPGAIRRLLQDERPDAVLVGTDVELSIFAENRMLWEQEFGTEILVSSTDVVEIADDKYATAMFLDDNGLSYPKSVKAEDQIAVANLIESVGFPLIVKPRRGARAVGVSKVHDHAELAAAIAGRVDLVVQQNAGDDDQEYTAGVIYFDNEVQASIVLRRDLRDGNTFRAYSGNYPEAEQYVHQLAHALKPYGPANFQFRIDSSGAPRLFEINARFSGTTPMRALFGFNEVEMCLRRLLFGEVIRQPEVRTGTVVRFLEEQFLSPEQFAAVPTI
jgi:carbamoyl-phosphate synthase large subunit